MKYGESMKTNLIPKMSGADLSIAINNLNDEIWLLKVKYEKLKSRWFVLSPIVRKFYISRKEVKLKERIDNLTKRRAIYIQELRKRPSDRIDAFLNVIRQQHNQ